MTTPATDLMASLKDMRFTKTKPIQNLPRIIGYSSDKLTAIEIIGSVENPKRITITGALAPDALDAAHRTGMIMAQMLDLMAPNWPNRHKWLTLSLKSSEKKQDTYRISLGYALVSLRYNKKSGIVAMNMQFIT